MAFREPMGFSPSATVRRASPKKKTAAKARRRAAVVGGVGRASPASNKEKRSMAKRKKARTAAQKRATAKMIAANKRRARSNPSKKAPKKIGVKTSPTGRRSVKVKSGTKISKRLTKPAQNLRNKARAAVRTGVKRTYKQYKNKKYGVVIRENPANRGKAILGAAAGFGLGIVSADILDRYVATRGKDGADAITDPASAKIEINKKPDGYRIFAQAAGTGVAAVGAYMLRKKSMVGAYLLGGVAAAFAAKALGMVVKGHMMPALLPAKDSESDFVKRLGYGDLSGPRGYMGAPRPFQGKPSHIGPQATGSVGAYGCTRVPVNPSKYMTPEAGRGMNCTPWPFQVGSQGGDCIDKVGRGPTWTAPRPFAPKKPTMPMPQAPTPPPEREVPSNGYTPPRGFQPVMPGPMPFAPVMPGGVIPTMPQQPDRPNRPGGVSPAGRFSPVSKRRDFTSTGMRQVQPFEPVDASGYAQVK